MSGVAAHRLATRGARPRAGLVLALFGLAACGYRFTAPGATLPGGVQRVRVPAASGEAEVRAIAEADDKVKAALAGKSVRKVIFVPKRLVNYVVG